MFAYAHRLIGGCVSCSPAACVVHAHAHPKRQTQRIGTMSVVGLAKVDNKSLLLQIQLAVELRLRRPDERASLHSRRVYCSILLFHSAHAHGDVSVKAVKLDASR